MTTITLRNVKGSALSFTEVDNNFTNLNTDKIEGITSSVKNPEYVYVLVNKKMPGICKIGMTTTSVNQRVKEMLE